jgi:hypothetical protein
MEPWLEENGGSRRQKSVEEAIVILKTMDIT